MTRRDMRGNPALARVRRTQRSALTISVVAGTLNDLDRSTLAAPSPLGVEVDATR